MNDNNQPAEKSLTELLNEIEQRANDKRVPKGPWIVRSDDAEECGSHAHSGLAMVLAPKDGSKLPWPPARLLEWPTAAFIAAARSEVPVLLAVIRESRRRYLVEVGHDSCEHKEYDAALAQLLRETAEKPKENL